MNTITKKNICPKCGCDVDVWEEVFNEEHVCPEIPEYPKDLEME